MEKQYFIQVGWDVAYKNKLDELRNFLDYTK